MDTPTAYRQAEEALHESEVRFITAFQHSPVSMMITSVATSKYVEANEAFLRETGFAWDEVIGHTSTELGLFFDPGDRERLLARVRDEGFIYSLEIRFRMKAGDIRDGLISAQTIKLNGEPHLLTTVIDMTERKRAAQALERRAAQLALLNDVGSQIAAVLELDKVLDLAARMVQASFGYCHVALFMVDGEPGEWTMTARAGDFADLFPATHRLKLEQGLVGWVGRHGARLLANDVRAEPRYANLYPAVIPTLSELCVPIHVGGETIGVLDVQSPRLNSFDDNDVMVMETLADQIAVAIENARLYEAVQRELAERQRTEAELQRRNEDLIALNAMAMAMSQVVAPSDVLTVALDTVLKITGARAGTIQVCGADPGQITHTVRRGADPAPGEEAAASQWRDRAAYDVLHTGQPLIVGADVAVYRSPLASDRGWLSPCAAVLIKSKSKVLGVLMLEGEAIRSLNPPDVQLLTAIGHEIGIALENAHLVEAAAEVQVLREVDRLRSELIANVSHELRTPLGLIKLFSTALLAKGFEFDRETQHEFLAGIDQETDRLEQLVNNLLDVSRIQSGRLHLSKQATDLAQLVRRVVKRIELPLTRHQFVQKLPERAVLAMVDPLRLEQVLGNLLSNAVKYSPAGGHITVRVQGDARQILIGVSDEGLGIPPADLEKVFERFYRVENELTPTVGGVGLGLAVARGIVEAHGGRIWVESTPGVGSHFYVSLPVGDVDHGR